MFVRELEAKRICHQCVGEEYLSTFIKKNGERARCDYCDRARVATIPLQELSEKVGDVIVDHFQRTPENPNFYQEMMLKDKESDYTWYRDGQPVGELIQELALVSEIVATDVRQVLYEEHADFDDFGIETEFDCEACYDVKAVDTEDMWALWWKFEKELKTKTRYFGAQTISFLETIFQDIDSLRTRDGRLLLVRAGPNKEINSFYRARFFENEADLKKAMSEPALELGPPPSKFASAGRMNSQGISVFYGADSPEAALAEIRPPVGSQVLVGKFELIKDITLLDLNTLKSVGISGSYFDPNFSKREQHAEFLSDLASLMSKPVMPNAAVFEYLATQVIAEYLSSMRRIPIDGILFPSAQTAHMNTDRDLVSDYTNVVLFNKSSRVKSARYPQGTRIDTRTWQLSEDGPEPDYRVEIIVKKPTDDGVNGSPEVVDPQNVMYQPSPSKFGIGDVDATLRIDTSSLSVHIVSGVSIQTHAHPVDWNETDECDEPYVSPF